MGDEVEAERIVFDRLLELGRSDGWRDPAGYLTHYLALHAKAAGRVEELTDDPGFLLAVEPESVISAVGTGFDPGLSELARLYMQCAHALTAVAPSERAAVLTLFAAQNELPLPPSIPGPASDTAWWPRWAASVPTPFQVVLQGHAKRVRSVSSVTVGARRLLVSASDDATVRLWDPAAREALSVFEAHQGPVLSVATATLDERPIAVSGGADGQLCVWDLETGTLLRGVTDAHEQWIGTVVTAETSTGLIAASAGHDRAIRIWSLTDGTLLNELHGHTRGIYAMCGCTTGNGTLLASGGADATVRVWNLDRPAEPLLISARSGWVTALTFAKVHGQDVLIYAGDNSTLYVVDPANGNLIDTVPGPGGCTRAIAYSETCDLLLSGGGNRKMHIANATTDVATTLGGHVGGVRSALIAEFDGRQLAVSGSDDRTIRIWDTAAATAELTDDRHRDWVLGVVTAEIDGRWVAATSGTDRTARVWDAKNGARLATLRGHTGWVGQSAFANVDHRPVLVTAGAHGEVRVWDVRDARPLRDMRANDEALLGVATLEGTDQTVAATAGNDGAVRLWNLIDGQSLGALHGHDGGVRCVDIYLDRDRPTVISGGVDGTVRLWDVASAKGRVIGRHANWVRDVALVDQSAAAIIASDDGTLSMWDLKTAKLMRTFHGHRGPVIAVACGSLEHRALAASASEDGTVRAWDIVSGRSIALPIPGAHGVALAGSSLIVATHLGVTAIDLLSHSRKRRDRVAAK